MLHTGNAAKFPHWTECVQFQIPFRNYDARRPMLLNYFHRGFFFVSFPVSVQDASDHSQRPPLSLLPLSLSPAPLERPHFSRRSRCTLLALRSPLRSDPARGDSNGVPSLGGDGGGGVAVGRLGLTRRIRIRNPGCRFS